MNNAFEPLPEISTEGFQVVSGSLFKPTNRINTPSVTLWNNSIAFSKASHKALNDCDCIMIQVNPKTKCMLIMPVGEKDKDAVRWKTVSKQPQYKRMECKSFTTQLYETWGFDQDNIFRAPGRLVSIEQKVMLLFDFSKAEVWKK